MLSTPCNLLGMPRKPLPLSEKRAHLGARVLPSLIDALKELGEADRRTLSFMVEAAIAEYVERHAPKPAPGKSPRRT